MPDLIYNFNSNSTPDGFSQVAGNTLYSGGVARGANQADNILTFGIGNSDAMLKITYNGNDTGVTSGTGAAGLMIRYSTSTSNYRLTIGVGKLTLRKDTSDLSSYVIPDYDDTVDYEIGFKAVGRVFTCYLDGVEITELGYTADTDEDAYIDSTTGAMYFYSANKRLDNLTVVGGEPSIKILGDNPLYIVSGGSYTEYGATATDVLDGDIDGSFISITENVDTNTEGTYQVSYAVTDSDGNTTVENREVIVRPANYSPDIELQYENLYVSAGASVTLSADVSDLDGDSLTSTWSQVSGDAVTLSDESSLDCYFTAPSTNSNQLLVFRLTATDGISTPTTKDVSINVAAIETSQRTSLSKTSISTFESTVRLSIDGEEGFNFHDVSIINKKEGHSLINEVVEFSDGKADIPLSSVRGVPYVGVVSEGTEFPADNAQPVMGASTGEITCRANEMINSRSGVFPSNLTSVSDLGEVDGSFYTENGGYVTKSGDAMMYSPNGNFDHLNSGEEAYDYIKYLVGSVEKSIPIKILPSLQTGVNLAGSNSLVTYHNFTEGKTYEIAFTVSELTAGEISPFFDVNSVNDNEYTLSKNAREVWHMKAPAGATSLTLTGVGGFDGTVSKLHVREVFKPAQAVSPRKLEIRSIRKAQPFLQPIMVPLHNVMDVMGEADEKFTGELYFNSQFGIRSTEVSKNISVIDAWADGKRSTISLEGGGYIYIDNVDVYCGYPTETSRFQQGYAFSDTNGDQFEVITMLNDHIDMGLTSHGGDYANGSNSDCTVLNSTTAEEGYRHEAYSGNRYLYDAGDGIIDSKMLGIANYMTAENGYRTIRGHTKSIHILANTELNTYEDTQAAISVAYNRSRVILFNTYVNGQRMVDHADMPVNDVVSADVSYAEALRTIHVAKTIPNVTDNILFAFDELKGQYKSSDSDTWIDLPPIHHNKASALGWHLNVVDGSYDFRVKSILGTTDGGWTYLNSEAVTNATD